MQFTANVGDILRALNLVSTVVQARSTIPIVTHVLIRATSGLVTIVGTDLDRECSTAAPADVEKEGAATVPASILRGIVSKLPKSGTLKVELDSKKSRVSVVSGRGRYALSTLPAEDFPEANTAEGSNFQIDARRFRALLEATIGSVSTEETRYYLRGVFLHIYDGGLVAVSTDGHRLCLRSMDLPAGAESIPGIIIPASAVNTLLTLLDGVDEDVSAWVTGARMWVKTPQAVFATRLIDGTYPDYRRVIPRSDGPAITICGIEFASAIGRAMETAPETKAVAAGLVCTPDGMKISVGQHGEETAVEHIDGEFRADAPDVAANARYLVAMTKAWGDAPIDIHIPDQGGPILFTSKDLPEQTYVIMPMRR